MKTTKSISKRLLTVLLVLTLVLSLAVPSMAENSKITIEPNSNTLTPTGDEVNNTELKERFDAYQIFAGSLKDYSSGTDGKNDPYDNPNANWLTDVTWGTGVKNIDKLLYALATDTTKLSDIGVSKDLIKTDPRYESAYFSASAKSSAETTAEGEFPTLENWQAEPENNGKTEDDYNAAKDAAVAAAVAAAKEAAFTAKNDLTLGDVFKAALEYAGYTLNGDTKTVSSTTDTTLAKTASLVAKVLDDLTGTTNNAALARAFAAVLTTKTDGSTYDYLQEPTPSSWNKDALGEDDGAWEIETEDGDGYYLIVDKYEPEGDDAVSDNIVGVFGTSTIKVKSSTTTGDKKLGDPNNPMTNTGVYEQGDVIPFVLSATLAANYANYSEFFLAFRDTMDKGLTYIDGSAKVTLRVDNPLFKKDEDSDYVNDADNNVDDNDEPEFLYLDLRSVLESTLGAYDGSFDNRADATEGKGYLYTAANGEDSNKTDLNVVFPDLKKIDIEALLLANGLDAYSEAGVTITGGDVITVTYSAYLNENAVINTPNLNQFHLEFSNNPTNPEGKGETPEKKVYIYDFGIDLYKYDISTGNHRDPLAGAGFNVSKTDKLYTLTNGTTTVKLTADELKEYIKETDIATTAAKDEEHTLGTVGLEKTDGKYSGYWFTNTEGEEVTLYAILKPTETDTYDVAGWITEADLKTVLTGTADGTITAALWNTTKTGAQLKNYAHSANGLNDETAYRFAAVTTNTGHLYFQGLEADKYTLKEVIVPEGYDAITGAYTVEFAATYYQDGPNKDQLKTLDATIKGPGLPENGDVQHIVIDGTIQSGFKAFEALLNVANTPNGWLPGTGGMGTTMFYVAGGVLLAAAALYLIFVNLKKRNVAQEQ